MKLYIKQKVFTWRDKFYVYDAGGNNRYYVEGEIFTLGKKLHLYDLSGRERSYIYQKVWSFLPRFFINQYGRDVAEIVKHFTFFRQEYSVVGPNWRVSGDWLAHEYDITSASGEPVAAISKRWFAWGDTYEIDIADGIDETLVLSVVLVIDAVLAQAKDN